MVSLYEFRWCARECARRRALGGRICRKAERAGLLLSGGGFRSKFPNLFLFVGGERTASGTGASFNGLCRFQVRARCLLKAVPLHSQTRRNEVLLVYDIVAAINALRSVAADVHRHIAGNAGALHVPDCGASQVVKKEIR